MVAWLGRTAATTSPTPNPSRRRPWAIRLAAPATSAYVRTPPPASTTAARDGSSSAMRQTPSPTPAMLEPVLVGCNGSHRPEPTGVGRAYANKCLLLPIQVWYRSLDGGPSVAGNSDTRQRR